MKEKIISILCEILECEPSTLEGAANFRDCGAWDSMAYLSAVAAIDDELGIVLTEVDFGKIKTIDDFVRTIGAKKKGV
jgi:acyl carrier protein